MASVENTGFVIAVGAQFIARSSSDSRRAPLTDSAIDTRYFKTREGAETTLKKLKNKVFRAELHNAEIVQVTLVVTLCS